MKTNNEIEKILLNDKEYDKLVKSKTEREFNNEIAAAAKTKETFITDIKEVPPEAVFSRASVFEVINKSSRTKSYINGVQAEGFLGDNEFDRAQMLKGKSSSFVCGDVYVKFIKCKIVKNV